ncbi:MAG: hypothetical protein WCI53_04145 [Bacteroidota bacterium]|jgi:hypothetical protein
MKNLIIFIFLFLILIFGCTNSKTEIPKKELTGEVISVCQDSLLTQWLDGNWYKNIVLNFKITNHSNRIYYTKSYYDKSLIYENYTYYLYNGDSIFTSEICDFYISVEDSILPNETKIYFTKLVPNEFRNNTVKVKFNYLFQTELADTTSKFKSVPLTFDLTKVVNCK